MRSLCPVPLVWLLLSVALCAALPMAIAQSANDEGLLQEAQWAEQVADYERAHDLYLQYLGSVRLDNSASNRRVRQSVTQRLSVLQEVSRAGPDPGIELLLSALTLRDAGEFSAALELLQELAGNFPQSYLRDDALYLTGYIALMDSVNFPLAHESMRRLLREYPDTTYYNTALYSEAIALEQLGNTETARERFAQLRDRHTRLSVGFLDAAWPRGNVLSRYWFDRADKRLGILDERLDSATRVVQRKVISPHTRVLQVTVDVDGMLMTLILSPSLLAEDIVLSSGDNQAIEQPAVRLYAGTVEGEENSWARVAIEGNSITGVIESYGARYVLQPDTLIGTIDYYQPKHRSKPDKPGASHDYVMHPPGSLAETQSRKIDGTKTIVHQVNTDPEVGAAQGSPVTRVAQLAVVVDSQYNDYYGGNGLTEALSVLNVADGIYREDFGLALEVVAAKVFSSRDEDPMNLGAVTLEKMLRNFRDYRMSNRSEFPAVSLMYLFSGNKNTDQAIGLAWIGAACRNDGFDVGVTTPSSYGDLLVTHELGHSLGAEHDTDTQCKSDTNRLMWPRISALTAQEFTSCSVNVLNAGLASACYLDSINVSLDLGVEELPESALNVHATVTNNDQSQTAGDVELKLDLSGGSIEQLPPGCTSAGAAEVVCNSGLLLPGQLHSWQFLLAPVTETGLTLLAQVKPLGATDVMSRDNSSQLTVRLAENGSSSVNVENGTAEQPTTVGNTVSNTPAAGKTSGSGALSFYLTVLLLFGTGLRRMFVCRRQG